MKKLDKVLNETMSELFEGSLDFVAEPGPEDGPMVYHGRPDDLKRLWNGIVGYFPKTWAMTKRYIHAKTAPDPEPGYFDQAKDWVVNNPLPAAGIGIGVPLAMAGSYYAYKKMKERKDRENAGM